jgi:multidrug resistance efflux pump
MSKLPVGAMIMKKQNQTTGDRKGFTLGKLIGLLAVVGLVGGGVWGGRHLLGQKKAATQGLDYWKAEKSDFQVTVKLTGELVSTDVVEIKCGLEGTTTIESIVAEGTEVKGNTMHTLKAGDTLESIAKYQNKDALSIQLLNGKRKLDWDKLPVGEEIEIPGDLLVELDPLGLEERISNQEIALQQSENSLNRAKGNMEILEYSTALSQKVANNSYTNAVLNLDKARNSTVKNRVKDLRGQITNLTNKVSISEAKLKWLKELEAKQFLSKMSLREEQQKVAEFRHNIEMAQAQLDAYQKYDKVSLLSICELAVAEAEVNIERTKVKNIADLRDANSTVFTMGKTLAFQHKKLEDLKEQMANTKIYAPTSGQVVYFAESYKEFGPIMNGARVHRGRNLLKLPKTRSLKVKLDVPQAKRRQLHPPSQQHPPMKAWVEIEGVTIPGVLSVLGATVDTNKRRHSETIVFNGEITIDSDLLPSTASEGMSARVEIEVINLIGDKQLIKVPSQCVTTRVRGGLAEQGCWVLNPKAQKPVWRPVTIEYHDEQFIAIKDELGTGRGLRPGEWVHLSPLSEAESLNLEEAVANKGQPEPNPQTPAGP